MHLSRLDLAQMDDEYLDSRGWSGCERLPFLEDPAVEQTLHKIETNIADPGARFNALRDWLVSAESFSYDLHEVEEVEEREGREIMRLLLQEHLNARGTGDVGPRIDVTTERKSWGSEETAEQEEEKPAGNPSAAEEAGEETKTLPNRRTAHRDYVSEFGKVDVNRTWYYKTGVPGLCVLDEDLSLPARSYSYEVQKKWLGDVVRGPFGDAQRRTSLTIAEPLSTQTGEDLIREAARDVDAFYAEQPVWSAAETGDLLVAAVDCKGVRLLEKELAKTKTKGKDGKKPKKKMATVAAVYTQPSRVRTPEDILKEVCRDEAKNEGGEAQEEKGKKVRLLPPEHKRVWASLTKSKDELFEEVGDEMDRRDPKRQKLWVGLTDGEEALQRRVLSIIGRHCAVELILDLYHVLEYLWEAAFGFHDKKTDVGRKGARQWVYPRLRLILEGKVSRVVAGMRQSATKSGLRGAKRKAVDKACKYFLRNKNYMRYDEYLAKGLPIGSGAAEGACRNLIKDRLECTGMRWSIATAEAVIKMRAVELTGHTSAYWEYHIELEHERLYGGRQWSSSPHILGPWSGASGKSSGTFSTPHVIGARGA